MERVVVYLIVRLPLGAMLETKETAVNVNPPERTRITINQHIYRCGDCEEGRVDRRSERVAWSYAIIYQEATSLIHPAEDNKIIPASMKLKDKPLQ